jgi:hypothetical protein
MFKYLRIVIATLVMTVSVFAFANELKPDQVPVGFTVLGSKTPERYNDYPIPTGFTEKSPENLNTLKLECTPQEISQGYVVFTKNYLDIIYPTTQPRRAEVVNQVSLFSAQGEYEPVTFSVHALKKLDNLRVSVSRLSNGSNTINANCIDLRSVRCVPRRVWRENSYIIKPTMLEKRDSVTVEPGRTQRYWMTIWTPSGKEPGIYTGTVTIQANGLEDFTLNVKHDVLDLDLEPSNIPQGMYYLAVDRTQKDFPAFSDETIYKDVINMKEHGMNTMMLIIPPAAILHRDESGKYSYDVSALRGIRDAVLAADFNTVIHNTTIDCIYYDPIYKDGNKLAGAYIKALESDGWPEVIYSYGDEADYDQGRRKDVINKLSSFKKLRPDLRFYSTIAYPENSEVFEPHLDIRPFSGYAGKATREKTRAAGREFWIYSGASGYGKDALGDRFYRGIWARTLQLDGALDWAYISMGTPSLPFNDLIEESHRDNFTCWVFPGDDGPIPSPGWEGLREGIEDWRYICRLEKLIAKADSSNVPQLKTLADEARNMLDNVFNDVDNSPIAHKKETVVNRERDKAPFNDPTFYQPFRRQMADYILRMKKEIPQ